MNSIRIIIWKTLLIFKSYMKESIKLIPVIVKLRKQSFSQTGEDLLIEKYLTGVTGSYLDIGSGSPVSGSNTFKFYSKGWRGTLVDPINRNIYFTKILRPKDKVYRCGIGKEGVQDFYEFIPYEYSTFDSSIADQRIQSGLFLKKKSKVSLMNLDLIVEGLSNPCFVSIDTEGFEEMVLSMFPWNKIKPDLFCVEEWRNPILFRTKSRYILEEKGYVLVAYTGLSSIYVLPKLLTVRDK